MLARRNVPTAHGLSGRALLFSVGMTAAGYRIFDADAHVYEPPALISQYIDPSYRETLANYIKPGQLVYTTDRVPFRRRLGSFEEVGQNTNMLLNIKPRWRAKPDENCSKDPHARIADMDKEGIDVGFILPTGAGTFCAAEDVGLERAVFDAYHAFMTDYCAPYPDRLKGALLVSGRDVEHSVQQIRKYSSVGWPVAIFPCVPSGQPIDTPDLDPLWAAAAEYGFAVALHTFSATAPYAPGVKDGSFFGNNWLARSATHPWCGMRNMAALLGSGILDRHPTLTIATLEAGHGWLPYWLSRLDEHSDEFMAYALPEGARKVSEYVNEGRYFQAIELHEGPAMTKYVMDTVRADMLMFSTDYPHGESRFPEAVETFLGWDLLSDVDKRKLLWDNAMRCFPRCA